MAIYFKADNCSLLFHKKKGIYIQEEVCEMRVLDCLGIEIFYIILTKEDVFGVISILYDMIEFNAEGFCPLSYKSQDMYTYTFNTEVINGCDTFCIKEYNPRTERIIDRVKVQVFGENNFFTLIESLYEEFLKGNSQYQQVGDYLTFFYSNYLEE